MLQQGGCGPQPVEGRCGEAEDELKHQEAAGDDCRQGKMLDISISIFDSQLSVDWQFY